MLEKLFFTHIRDGYHLVISLSCYIFKKDCAFFFFFFLSFDKKNKVLLKCIVYIYIYIFHDSLLWRFSFYFPKIDNEFSIFFRLSIQSFIFILKTKYINLSSLFSSFHKTSGLFYYFYWNERSLFAFF